MRFSKMVGCTLPLLAFASTAWSQGMRLGDSRAYKDMILIGSINSLKNPRDLAVKLNIEDYGILELRQGDGGVEQVWANTWDLDHARAAIINFARRNKFSVDLIDGIPSSTKNEVDLIAGEWPDDNSEYLESKWVFDMAGHMDLLGTSPESKNVQIRESGWYTLHGNRGEMQMLSYEKFRLSKTPLGETQMTKIPNSRISMEGFGIGAFHVAWITKNQVVFTYGNKKDHPLILSRGAEVHNKS